jgi:hypothetical protein
MNKRLEKEFGEHVAEKKGWSIKRLLFLRWKHGELEKKLNNLLEELVFLGLFLVFSSSKNNYNY